MAHKLLGKQPKQLWKEVKKVKGDSSSQLAFTIDNTSGQKNNCDLWKGHCESLLNLSKPSSLKQDIVIVNKLKTCTSPDDPFSPSEVNTALKDLKNGKACGQDGLQSEHFKFGPEGLSVLLCLVFNAIVLHSYLPQGLMDTVLIPIIKDKKGNLSSKENYRLIAIASVISKTLETVILNRFHYCLVTSDNQFGFKNKHSTDLCTFVLKQIIDYYTHNASPVYICYLDASKAFN